MDTSDAHTFSLHEQLKKACSALHQQAHKLPYIQSLLHHELPQISYIGYLRCLAIIYGTVENQLKFCPSLGKYYSSYQTKLDLLLADLQHIAPNREPDVLPAISTALHLADMAMLYASTAPHKLLGFTYVLEGSLNGGDILKTNIAQTFCLQSDSGIQYLSGFTPEFQLFWADFIAKLNSEFTDSIQQQDIIATALEVFEGLIAIYTQLHSATPEQIGQHISALNPEAGNFPIPTNPLEIEAAIKAGMYCWQEFPYFEIRYGARGRRFTVSDSVWLVTLCELPVGIAVKQVDWLVRVLATRGIPSLTMEVQLEAMCRELSQALPENEQKYKILEIAAAHIRSLRQNFLPDAMLENCKQLFERNINQASLTDVRCLKLQHNLGGLLASAMADKKNGIALSSDSFVGWISDAKLFPNVWGLVVGDSVAQIEGMLD
ncbi:MAG: hypothetical protein RIS47_932 [Bacteroidota bacterium]